MIKILSLEKCKGISRAFTLSPITYFQGENGSGKSAVLDGVRLALLGSHPDVGKTNSRVIEFGSGDKMSCEAVFDSGDRIKRVWERKGSSVSSASSPAEWDADPRLELTLNPATYFAKPEGEQMRTLFAMLKSGGDVSETIQSLSDGLGDWAAELLRSLSGDSGPAIVEWLESATKEAKALKREASATIKALKGTMETAATDTGITEILNAVELEKAKKAKADKDEEIERVTRTLAQWESIQGQADNAAVTLENLRNWLENCDVSPVDPERWQTTLKEIEELGMRIDDAAKAADKLAHEAGGLEASVGMNEQMENELRKKGAVLESTKADAHCPTCGNSGEGWREKAIAAVEAELADLAQKQLKARKELDASRAEKSRVYSSLREMQQEKVRREKEMQELQTEQTRVELRLRRKAEVEHEIKDLTRKEFCVPGADEIHEMELRKSRLRDELGVLEQQIGRAMVLADRKAQEQKTLEKLERIESHLKEINTFLSRVEDKKRNIVEGVFGEVLQVSNRFLDGVFDWKLAYCAGAIGRFSGDQFITYRTFSGSEKALAYLAVTIALASTATERLGIIDELDRFDERRKEQLVKNLRGMIDAGILDQVLLAGTHPVKALAGETVKL